MQVKDAILDAGCALLKDKGIAALTQPQVARAAGIKQSHLTYYFPTRADLLLAIAEHAINSTLAGVGERIDGQATFDRLAELMIGGIPPRLIVGLIVAADAEPEIRATLSDFIAHVRERLQTLLAASGIDADAESALLLHATLVGLAIMHQARLTSASGREVKDGVAAIMRRLATASKEDDR